VFAKKIFLNNKMKLLSLFFIVMVMAIAFINLASAQRAGPSAQPVAPTPHPNPKHHSHKQQEYHRHIFRKRDLIDFPEYQDSHI
jgi:hypothetical protein